MKALLAKSPLSPVGMMIELAQFIARHVRSRVIRGGGGGGVFS